MEIKQLRIGNLILFNGEYREISSLHNDNTLRLRKGNNCEGCYSINNIKPIELTEEILMQCGFLKVRYEKFSHDNFKKLKAFPHPMINGFGIYLEGFCSLPNVKHLHQLQNIYFSLTGEELQINL